VADGIPGCRVFAAQRTTLSHRDASRLASSRDRRAAVAGRPHHSTPSSERQRDGRGRPGAAPCRRGGAPTGTLG
jgi:hypothetical protein